MQLDMCSSKEDFFMRGDLYEKKEIKPVFSGHETFPLRYGWIKKVYDEVLLAEKAGQDAKDVFNNPASISVFGVGKNMVSSMRHWASYTGIIKDNKITSKAKDFFDDRGLDPWLENSTTLWFLHYNLATNTNLITYHWFFNYYNGGVFDRKTINDEIIELCRIKNWSLPAPVTIKRDVECFIRTYVSKEFSTNNFDDDTIESPLAELSLIKSANKYGYFSPNRGIKHNLKIGVFIYSLLDFWESKFNNSSTLSLESILFDPCSPGRVFLLDEEAVLEKITNIEEMLSGKIIWSETAGMRQLIKQNDADLTKLKQTSENIIKKEYSLQ